MSNPSARENPLPGPPQPDDDVSQSTVVHIHHPTPRDPARVQPQLIPVMHMIVHQRRKQIVRQPDGGEVPGEMQVDVLHRNHLREPSPRRASLHSKDGAERRLPQGDRGLLPDSIQRVRESDRGRRLPLARRSRRDGGDQNQFPVRLFRKPLRQVGGKFGLEVSVRTNVVRPQPAPAEPFRGQFGDGAHLRRAGDFQISFHFRFAPFSVFFALCNFAEGAV